MRMAVTTLALMVIFAVPNVRAETAVSIEYDFVERPTHVPDAFASSAGVALRFMAIKAIDGERIDAALWQPSDKAAVNTTLIIGVHGSASNFTEGAVGVASPELSRRGYGVLGINTRQHDDRANTDNFLNIRRDIEAAVYSARALGYRNLVLFGQSLGNIHVQYYAANNWDTDIKAVVLTGMFANLPWRTRHILVADEDAFRRVSESAFKALREGKERELLPLGLRRPRGQEEPLTGDHFLTYRSEASSTADGTYWIKRIPRPILMVRDSGDSLVQPFEPYMLLSAATSEGSLVPSIKYELLPNPKGVYVEAHGFADNAGPLAETIATWLRAQGL